MSRRKFVIASSVLLVFAAGIIAGLALYSGMIVNASIADLPKAVRYLPADSQAVFGMNVKKFIASPVYAKLEAKHGDKIGTDLAEFIAKTGVDPRKDIDYIVAGGKSLTEGRGQGVVIAVGRFNTAAITGFIDSHFAATQVSPVRVDYKNATVHMIPEAGGNKVDKGIAFLSDSEIALGNLESLKGVLDVRENSAGGLEQNATLAPLLDSLNPEDMFWFAGDPSAVLSRAPANTPLGGGLSAIKDIFGTLNLTDVVSGKVTVTAKDKESAAKLADIARGLVALAQLAGDKSPEIADLLRGVLITQDSDNKIHLAINFPFELIERLEHARPLEK